jgi:calcineurin-like phosphoesterase family protein
MKYCRRYGFAYGLDYIDKQRMEAGEKVKVTQEAIDLMNNYLWDGINNTVGEDDTLYILGDVLFTSKKRYYERAKEVVGRINCKNIHLIIGNHDYEDILEPLFSSVQRQKVITVHNQDLTMCHHAMVSWDRSNRKATQLYGHYHGGAEEWLDKLFPTRKSMDVGVDNVAKILAKRAGLPEPLPEHYRPLSILEIQEIMAQKRTCDPQSHARMQKD